MTGALRASALLLAFALAAGCSGASGTLPIQGAGRTAARGHAVFHIAVPKNKGGRAHGKHGRYVSAATQSLTIDLSGPTGVNETVGVTPASPNCAPTLQSTVCTFAIDLAPGDYTASIVAYDNVVPASGNELSAAQSIPVTIVTGASNDVHLTLSGVPAQLVLSPASRGSILNVQGGIDLLGIGSHPITVQAVDADGNIIVGPGSPAFSVSQTGGALGVTLATPAPTSPNTFALTPPAAYSTSTATIQVTASFAGQPTNGCNETGAACTKSTTFDMRELLAARGFSSVVVFAVGQTAPLATINAGITNPQSIAFSPVGDILVANCLAGCNNGSSPDTIAKFAAPYTALPVLLSNGLAGPAALALDPQGDLFVGNCGSCSLAASDFIAEYASPLSASSAPAFTNANFVTKPSLLTFDASGNLFVVMNNGNVVREYAPPYTGSPIASVAGNNVDSVAVDANGNLFLSNNTGSTVTEWAPPSYTTLKATISSGVSSPDAIGLDGSGNLFVLNGAGNTAREYSPPFTNLSTPVATMNTNISGPTSLVVDATGTVFIANGNTGTITEYVSPYTSTAATFNVGVSPNQLVILP